MPEVLAAKAAPALPANAYTELRPNEVYEPLVTPFEKPPELTARSIGWGVFLCVIFTVASAYSGLKVGQLMEAAIPISILTIGLARIGLVDVETVDTAVRETAVAKA